MELFQDRFHAGQVLAKRLEYYRGTEALVLALPRGGVPVAFEVAKKLGAALDIFLVRKLGLPGHQELAMGAVASGGLRVLNHEVIEAFHVSESVINRVAAIEQQEIDRQQSAYRGHRLPPSIHDRVVILVDDGLATGSTMRAAARALRQEGPKWLVVAVPVGAPDTCSAMHEEADEVICAIDPERFMSVGSWYLDFSPTSDDTVKRLLQKAREWEVRAPGNGEKTLAPHMAKASGE
jgi:putative phosphoribosyl transferase